MSTTTKRLLVGGALTGAVVLGIGAPALAAVHPQHTATHHQRTHVATVTTTAPAVQIGTAVQYVRNADGTISMVTPH